jgi:mono/diheme cytochrome c family protein
VKRARAGSLMSASLAAMIASLLLSAPASADGEGGASARGRTLFETYCVLCHGAAGKGDGRAAGLQKVRPSDLTVSARSDDYKLQIISNGGAAMSRSEGMPPWKTVLTHEQITEVVAYLRVMVEREHTRSAAADASSHGVRP